MKRPGGYDRARETPESLASDESTSAGRGRKRRQERQEPMPREERSAAKAGPRRAAPPLGSASSDKPSKAPAPRTAAPGAEDRHSKAPSAPAADGDRALASKKRPALGATSRSSRTEHETDAAEVSGRARKRPVTTESDAGEHDERAKTRKVASLRPAGSTLAARPLDPEKESARAKKRLAEAERERARYEKKEVRRFTGRARRRRISLIAGVAVVAVFAILLGIALFSPALALREIKVVGSSRVSASSIQAALNDNIGTPLPRIDQKHIETEMKRFTLIESFSTQAVLPSTLVIHVVERTPVAAVPRGDRFAIVDSAGIELERADKAPDGLPTVDLGDASTESARFHNAAEVLVALPVDFRPQVQSIEAKSKDDVTLTLRDGKKVLWGGPERSAEKAANLTAFVKANPKSDISQFDVSTPDQVVTK